MTSASVLFRSSSKKFSSASWPVGLFGLVMIMKSISPSATRDSTASVSIEKSSRRGMFTTSVPVSSALFS